jgi:cytoskeleton protein RodZ
LNSDYQRELIPLTLGESLHMEREKRGLSVEQLAADLRVRPAILLAIESDATGHIPQVYLKGYIRNYARLLGIRPDDIEVRMGEARGIEPPVQSVFARPLPRDRSERWFKATSYVLASAVVIALVWQFTTEAVRFSQGDPVSRSTGTESSGTEAADPAADGSSRKADELSRAKKEPANSHLRASIASVESAGPERQVERRSVAEGAWAAVGNRGPIPGATDDTPAATNVLSIATSADSWVEIVDGDGEKIEMDLLRAGSRRNYNGPGPFRLLLGRASSIELSYNGKPVDLAPHTRGNVARVTLGGEIPAESAAPALQPPIPSEPDPAAENPDQG